MDELAKGGVAWSVVQWRNLRHSETSLRGTCMKPETSLEQYRVSSARLIYKPFVPRVVGKVVLADIQGTASGTRLCFQLADSNANT